MTRLRIATLALLVTALVAGCTSASPPAPTGTGSFPAAQPVGVRDPAVIPSSSAGPAPNCDPLASLQPPAALPAPGQMPTGSTMAAIVKRGRLIVGVDQNTYLFGYRDAVSGQIVGFDIDVARALAQAIFGDPNKIQLTAITAAQRVPFLRSGQVDVVVDTMTINCDRLRQIAFSTVYYNAGQRVLVPSDSTVTSIAGLGGKKVCAADGSTSIANIAAAAGHPVPVSVADWTDCLVLLQQGQVDAISTDDTILAGLAAQDPHTKLVGPRFTDEPYGVGIGQSHTDLVRFVNGVLAKMRGNGAWAALYVKWLGGPAPAPPAARYRG